MNSLSNKNNLKKYKISAQEQIMWAHKYLFPEIFIELKEKIDIKILKEAVVEAFEIHPLYKTRLVKSKTNQLFWEENNKEPIIKEYDPNEAVVYGTNEYNNFPWLMRYSNKKIIITSAHMLSDGVGLLHFIKTFLILYFEKKGIKLSDISKLDFTKDTAYQTIEDSYLKNGSIKQNFSSIDEKKVEPKFIAKEFLLENEETAKAYKLIINKPTIKKIVIENNVKIAAVISSLLAKTLEKTLNLKDSNILIPIPVDCRRFFSSNTDRNFLYCATLNYNIDSMKDMSVISLAKEFTKQLEVSITKEKMLKVFNKISNLTDELNKNPQMIYDIRNKLENVNKQKTTTIDYSSINNLGFPDEFNNLIQNVYVSPLTPLDSTALFAICVAFNNKMMFAIKTVFKDDTYIKNLESLLKQESIDYTLTDFEYKFAPRFDTFITED